MNGLDSWLEQATRRLANCSAAQVRSEIREHYEAAREAAMNAGASEEEADRVAIAALGNPRTGLAPLVNRWFQLVPITRRFVGAESW